MEPRVLVLADQLLLIERELRLQGLWAAQAPAPEALASTTPFCVDTLPFEGWLQWIFLPRMKQLLESGSALPRVSGIRPMAEEAYKSEGSRLLRLIELLGEVDQALAAP
jgi:uncharacterized protein YqcC (DUF446 family)